MGAWMGACVRVHACMFVISASGDVCIIAISALLHDSKALNWRMDKGSRRRVSEKKG